MFWISNDDSLLKERFKEKLLNTGNDNSGFK